jgi:hypothetical protein
MQSNPLTARSIVWLMLISITVVGCTGARRATSVAGVSVPGDPGVLAGDPQGLEARVPAESASVTDGTLAATDRNVRVHPLEDIDHGEGHIAIDPNDPDHLVATGIRIIEGASNDETGIYTSFDGGATWSATALPPAVHPSQVDPVVAICPDGTVLAVILSTASPASAIVVMRSGDGGLTFPSQTTVASSAFGLPFLDKPWIACDASGSAFDGRAYVEWGASFPDGLDIRLATSDDSGATWSTPVTISDARSSQNQANIAIGPAGEVHVVWVRNTGSGIENIADRSLNGGATWGADVVVSDVFNIPDDPTFPRGSLPQAAVDASSGPHSGNLYVAWADDRNPDPDILFVRSEDGGATWSAPVRVNDDPFGNGADQFLPTLAVDALGRVIVGFYDRRRFAGQTEYETWAAVSRDGGRTFDTNFVLSDVESDGSLQGFMGDYNGVVGSSTRLHPLWLDHRRGVADRGEFFSDAYPHPFRYDEVRDVRWTSKDDMTFEEQDARFGQDLDYDVVDGLVSELVADGGFARATCSAAAWPTSPFTDTRVPPLGDARYYLVRAHGPDGVGTYGYGEPQAREDLRDPLDDTAICP